MLGMWLALVLVQPIGTAAKAAPGLDDIAPLESGLHTAINEVRAEQGLLRLERDPTLDAVARAHSEDMAARHYMAHETPEGLTPPARMKRAGVIGYTLAGESDLDRGTVDYLVDERRQASLDSYFDRFTAEQRAGIEAVAMDMWEPYINSARANLKLAAQTYDTLPRSPTATKATCRTRNPLAVTGVFS